VKVTRYQLMPFTDLYSPEYADYVEDLKAIQKHLGNIQDTIVINDLLSNYCLEDHYETLPEITKKVQDLQIESWENWQSLKTKYLQSNTKNEWRKIIINNP
jgi:CHAD domain-containing protein